MGEYMDWYLMDPAYAATTNRQYITIVNLTPHEFKLTYSHANQMDHWDWDSIPPGKSRQNLAHYTETVDKNPIDSKGEAYYDVGNTGKKFVVRVTNNIPNTYTKRIIFDLTGMGKGQREYKAPEQKVPVTLVITGSDSYGFVTSLSHGPGNWMNAIKDAIAHRKVLELIVPGTHDSGMSKITGAILTAATESNTQTQGLNIYNQLRVGARWFDLRVSTVHEAVKCCENYEFWTTHLSDEMATLALGRSGEKLDEVIDEVNQFTGENPGEIIFLEFRYLIGIRNVPSLGPLYWTNAMKDEFFDKLKKINNRCPGLPEINLQNQIIGDLMARNDGKGCVLILINTSRFRDITTPHISPGDGIYNSHAIDWFDSWPNTEDTKDVAEFVINSENGWKKRNGKQFHVTQWLSTPNFLTSTFSYSLQEIALLPTNSALYWRGVIDMKPDNYPNVIMVDYIGMVLLNEPQWNSLSAELYTLAIGLNLYMLSENCIMNTRRSPLLPSRKNSRRPFNPLVADFNGVIFANGTVWDNPPPDFHLGRDEFLQNGTVFSNGTVFRKSTVLHRTARNTHLNLTEF
ncbi:PLC-like phosphodiesterase [Colletotrichum cereale]|nr:PLC-like phosphodiesterase [Colletotrichum cereale]